MNPAPLPTDLRAAAPDLARRLGVILAGLAALVARAFLRNPRRVGVIVPLWNYLGRTGRRFARLMARLPAPAAPRPGRVRPARVRVVAWPEARGWLVADLRHEAVGFGLQLTHLLDEPAAAALVAEFPQGGRLLRPICWMLGVSPGALARPTAQRTRTPRPPATAKRANPRRRPEAPPEPSVFLPRPARQLCPALLARWPWASHSKATPA